MGTKQLLSEVLDRGGLLRADLLLRGAGVVVAVNYHGTPAHLRASLERHFAFYRERFECLDELGLLGFLSGQRRLPRTGVVISFDDGLRDNAEVAAPLLERYGLRGWFMVPGGFVEAPPAEQDRYFREHVRAEPNAEHPQGSSARAMSWDGVRALAAAGHVIGCHTWTHRPLGPRVPAGVVEDEVAGARRRLEQQVGRPVRTFCWVRGRVEDYSARAHQVVRRSYDLAFMTGSSVIRRASSPLALHRFNVEASYPLALLRFQISRLNEAYFLRRRRAVERAVHL